MKHALQTLAAYGVVFVALFAMALAGAIEGGV